MGIADSAEPNIEPKKRGRPQESGFKQEFFMQYVKPHAPELVKKGVALALGGEPTLLKYFIAMNLPKNPLAVSLTVTDDPIVQINNIMSYCLEGHCTADEAVKLVSIVKERVQLEKYSELETKMQVIEAWMKDQAQGVTHDGTVEKLDSEGDEAQGCIAQSAGCAGGEEDTGTDASESGQESQSEDTKGSSAG